MTHAWTHAWCKSPARDEAVRAAEDGRDRPLPTLEECIERQKQTARPCGGTDAAPSRGERVAADTGMRTERITLEVTHNESFGVSHWSWVTILRIKSGESVRVVEDDRILAASKKLIEVDQEAALRGFDTTTFQRLWISAIARVLGLELARPPRSKCDNPGDGSIPSPGILASPALVEAHQQIAALTAERDAAIRERDEIRQSWLRSEESGTRLLAERNAALDAADGLRKRVAELEAASGGGEGDG
jgi:hypothetical protein